MLCTPFLYGGNNAVVASIHFRQNMMTTILAIENDTPHFYQQHQTSKGNVGIGIHLVESIHARNHYSQGQ